MIVEVGVLFVLVLINGVLAGSEIATVTVRQSRIEQLAAAGRRDAKAVATLRANPERFLATVQIGITVVGAAAAAYGGDTFSDRLAPLLTPLLGTSAHAVALMVVVAAISYLSLVLGELVPKSLALRSAEGYALLVARPLLVLAQLTRPLVWLLTRSSNVVLKAFGDSTSFTESRMSADELKTMLTEAGLTGSLHPRVGEIASRAMDLNELSAYDIMVPRHQIDAIQKSATLDSFRDFVGRSGHSRIPVFEETLDQIVGYVSVRDVFTRGQAAAELSELVRPIQYVPETARAADILHTLQSVGAELAIVVDEHGGTAGLLTREDLAEELFGEMIGGTSPAADSEVQREPDGTLRIDGAVLVRDLNRRHQLRLTESDDWSTIAGMAVGIANRIPAKGDRIEVGNGDILEIVDASPRRVRTVRLHLAPRPNAEVGAAVDA